MSVENQETSPTPYPVEADLSGLSAQERTEKLIAVSLARAQEKHRESLNNPNAKFTRPTRYGRVRNDWRNAYD